MADICPMKLVITSATLHEVSGIKEKIANLGLDNDAGLQVIFHKSGVGTMLTAISLSTLIAAQRPDLIVQAGIAGTFDPALQLGAVLTVKEEFLGDVGVEEHGSFNDIFDMKLESGNEPPFFNKALPNPWLERYNLLNLPAVAGVTINEVSTRHERIEQLRTKYGAVIESMEGAPLHYIGLQTNIPFMQVRAISNYVGERDKGKWQIKKALDNLTGSLLDYILKLSKMTKTVVENRT